MNFLLVGIGGGIGAICRYCAALIIKKIKKTEFPMATLVINIVGSFFLGGLVALSVKSEVYLLFGTGFLGGFTTFSTFGYEVMSLYHNQKYRECLVYIRLSVFCCLGGTILGMVVFMGIKR